MAKANLVLPDGTKVAIEGTANEVAVLLAKFSEPSPAAAPKRRNKKKQKSKSAKTRPSKASKRKGPQQLIADLAEDGFFKSKRTIKDVQKKLEEKGHIYAQTSLSTPLLRLTRNRVIRRLKENKGWVYVI